MIEVLKASTAAWFAKRAASKGAALAFYTLFSMAPILLLAIAVAGYFFGADAARGEIVSQMQMLVGPNGAQAIQALLAAAQDPASGLIAIVVAGVLLVIGATSVFVELKGSLDELWGVDKPDRSAFALLVTTQLRAFMLVLFLGLMLVLSLLTSLALAVLERYVGGFWSSSSIVLATLSAAISFSVIVCLFAVIFKMLPDVPLSWRDVWTGALFTAVLFFLGKFAISLYLGKSAVASGFGAAGSIVALLLWVYYSAQIFFLGAEFTRQYALRCGSLRPPDHR
jgi:membrane protein